MARTFSITTDALVKTQTSAALPALTTLSLWVKPAAWADGDFFHYLVVCAGSGLTALFHDLTNIKFSAPTGSFVSFPRSDMANGVWHHLLATCDNSTGTSTIWLNGVQKHTRSDLGTQVANITSYVIGNRADQTWVAGADLAEYGRWNRLLSDVEIAALAKGFSPTCIGDGLVDYVPIWGNGTSEFSVIDHSNYAVQGTSKTRHAPQVYPAPNSGTVVVPKRILTSAGSIGTANSKTTDQATLVLTTTATAEAGNVVVVIVAKDNTQTTNAASTNITLADSATNTWTKLGERTYSAGAAKDGTTVAMFVSQLTNQLASSGTITATLGGTQANNDASAMTAWEFVAGSGIVLDVATAQVVTNGFASGTTNVTHTLSSLPSKRYLWLHALGLEWNADIYTAPTGYTEIVSASSAGSTSATNQTVSGAFRVFTDTNQTISTTVTGADKASIFAAIPILEPARISANAGDFALAGQDAGLVIPLRDLVLPADVSAFAHTGIDAGVLYGRTAIADAEAFTVAGQAAVLIPAYLADAGAYDLAGQDATFLRTYSLLADAAPFDLAGQDAGLLRTYNPLSTDTGPFDLAGKDAAFSTGVAEPTSVPDEYSPNEDLTWVQKATHIWAVHPSDPTKADKGGLTLQTIGAPTALASPENTMQFDGVDDWYQTLAPFIWGDNPTVAGNQTPPAIGAISLWVYLYNFGPGNFTRYCGQYSAASTPWIGCNNSGFTATNVNGLSFVGGTPANAWFHVAVTNNATYRRLYLNGAKVHEAANDSVAGADQIFGIAQCANGREGGTSYSVNGRIRLVSVINGDVWTDAEILAQYQHPYAYYASPEAAAFVLPADAGAFDLAGQAVQGQHSYVLQSEASAFALGGQAATVVTARVLASDATAFALSGQPAAFQTGLRVLGDTGAFALSGQPSTALYGRNLVSALGAFSLAGQDAAVTTGRRLQADAAAFTWTGQQAGLSTLPQLAASAGAFDLAGQAATFRGTHILSCNAGALDFTGQTAELLHILSLTLLAGRGSFDLASTPIDLRRTYTALNSQSGGFALAGQTAATLATHIAIASSGPFLLTGQSAGLIAVRNLVATAGALTLTGRDVVTGLVMTATGAAYALAGQTAAFIATRKVVADQGAHLLSGQSAGLVAGRIFVTDTGAFTLAGKPAVLSPVRGFPADTGVVLLDGQPVSALVTWSLSGEWGAYLLSGQDAALQFWTVPTGGAGRTYYVEDPFTLSGTPAEQNRIFYIPADPTMDY